MHDILIEVRNYVQSATRYKWVSLSVAWIICLSGWIFISKMPDEYQSSARINVDTRSVLRPLLKGIAIHPDVKGQIRLMTRLIFTRPNLEKIARMTDLDLEVKGDAGMDALVGRLKSSMSIAAVKRSNLFSINAVDSDPEIAKRKVQSLLTIFVEETLGETRKDSDSARRFIINQIKEYETRLLEAEFKREEFKRDNFGMLPGQGGDLYSQIQGIALQIEEAKFALKEEKNRRNELKKQLDGEEPTFEAFEGFEAESPLSANPTDARIQALQQQLDDLLLNFTEAHPRVLVLKNAIKELEKRIAEQADSGLPMDGFGEDDMVVPDGQQANPVFQQVKIALSEADANIASLKARVGNYEAKIETLKNQLDARLKIETKIKALNRDYNAIKSKFDTLTDRLETAKLSESVEENTDAVNFRIVEPPRVPTTASGPDRIVLSLGVFVVAIVVGIAVAVLLTFFRPTFWTSKKIQETVGLPVLGTVSMTWIDSVKKQKWQEFIGFCVASIVLVVILSAIIVLEVQGVNLSTIS